MSELPLDPKVPNLNIGKFNERTVQAHLTWLWAAILMWMEGEKYDFNSVKDEGVPIHHAQLIDALAQVYEIRVQMGMERDLIKAEMRNLAFFYARTGRGEDLLDG